MVKAEIEWLSQSEDPMGVEASFAVPLKVPLLSGPEEVLQRAYGSTSFLMQRQNVPVDFFFTIALFVVRNSGASPLEQ